MIHGVPRCTSLARLLAVIAIAIPVWTQQTTAPTQTEVRIENAGRIPGEILTKGSNQVPSGKLKVKSYRLERVKFTQPLVLAKGGTYEYGYKLVVTGGPFRTNHLIWVDDRPFSTVPNIDGSEIIAVFLNGPNILEDGATLSVSEGANPCGADARPRSMLPEKLDVPLELRAAPLDGSAIKLRTVPPDRWYLGKPAVGVSITLKHPVQLGNNTVAIQVGKQSFDAGGWGSEVGAQIPTDVFRQIPDNSQVFVKWGLCSTGGEYVGRLNKSALDH